MQAFTNENEDLSFMIKKMKSQILHFHIAQDILNRTPPSPHPPAQKNA